MRLILTTLILSALLQGCASMNYSGRFEASGLYDPTKSQKITQKAEELKWADAEDIMVFIGELPAGIIEENGKYRSDNSNLSLLGTISAQPSNLNQFTVFFDDYSEDEDWRNVYCPIQGALLVGTLMIWQATPFPWLCFVQEGNTADDIEARKVRIINTLKKTAMAAGGNAIVVTKLGSIQYVAGDSRVMGTLDMTSAEALVLKVNTPLTTLEPTI